MCFGIGVRAATPRSAPAGVWQPLVSRQEAAPLWLLSAAQAPPGARAMSRAYLEDIETTVSPTDPVGFFPITSAGLDVPGSVGIAYDVEAGRWGGVTSEACVRALAEVVPGSTER